MPRVNFKSYMNDSNSIPTELQIIVSTYGPYLTLKDAAQCLHRSYETIYDLVRSGTLKASRTGKRGGYIIPANAIITFVKKNMSL